VITRIDENLSLLVASALSPDMPLKPTTRPPLRLESQYVSGLVRGNKIGTCKNLASACVPSGYSVLRWRRCGNLTHLVDAEYRLHQHDVDM
jgi:hypothetical protein